MQKNQLIAQYCTVQYTPKTHKSSWSVDTQTSLFDPIGKSRLSTEDLKIFWLTSHHCTSLSAAAHVLFILAPLFCLVSCTTFDSLAPINFYQLFLRCCPLIWTLDFVLLASIGGVMIPSWPSVTTNMKIMPLVWKAVSLHMNLFIQKWPNLIEIWGARGGTPTCMTSSYQTLPAMTFSCIKTGKAQMEKGHAATAYPTCT